MNNEKLETMNIKKINKERREDIKVLMYLRIKEGIKYNSLKYLYSLYVLHCSDLSKKSGKKIISSLGNEISIKSYDIRSQIHSFYKNSDYFNETGENPFHYSNYSLRKNLKIKPKEEKELKYIVDRRLDDSSEIIKKDLDSTFLSNENVDEQYDECDNYQDSDYEVCEEGIECRNFDDLLEELEKSESSNTQKSEDKNDKEVLENEAEPSPIDDDMFDLDDIV